MPLQERIGLDLRWLTGLTFGCLGIGVLIGAKPSYGVAAAVGLTVAIATLTEVVVGLVLFTFLSFFEVFTATGGTASLMKVLGLLVFASWAARELTHPRQPMTSRTGVTARAPGTAALMIAGIVLVAWSTLSMAWANSPSVAWTSSYRYLLNLLLFPIAVSAIRRREHMLAIIGAYVLGGALSSLYGFANPVTSVAGAGRLAGSIGDPNDQAAVLVAAIPLALALSGNLRQRPVLRWLPILAAVICLAGAVNTYSRGGLIALACVMLAGVAFGGRWRRIAVVALLIGALGTVTYLVAIAPASSASRVTSGDTSGRSDLWRLALRIIKAHPVAGIGSGNFQTSAAQYVLQPGAIHSASLIVTHPHVAHDVYLELLADLGPLGLLAFVSIAFFAGRSMYRATRVAERRGEVELEMIARALLLALVGFMVSDIFLSGQFSKQLWLVMALGPPALALARGWPSTFVRDRRGEVPSSSSRSGRPSRVRLPA